MTFSLIDTHCHLNFDSYAADRDEVLARAQAAGVNRFIIPAVDLDTAREAIALAERYTSIYVAVGIHPNSTAKFTQSDIVVLTELAAHPSVVAIGEIGLDYHWHDSPREKQFEALRAQLDLAARLEKPVIIHNREASEDVMLILEQWSATVPAALVNRVGVLHSFSAEKSIADRALAAGFYLGFTGPITYKNADDLRRIATSVPSGRLLLETDGPFLTPLPHRGKRNEPAYIPLILDRLAVLRGQTVEELGSQTSLNAQTLFALPPEAQLG